MNLIDRIIGISSYLLFVVITCLLLKDQKPKNKKCVLIFALFLLLIMSYCYTPFDGKDYYRIVKRMSYYGGMNYNEIIHNLGRFERPVQAILLNILFKFDNENILKVFACFITYSCFFYILYDSYLENGKNAKTLSVSFFILMSRGSFEMICSNVFTGIVIGVFSICLYKELIKNKPFFCHLPIYFALALLHNVGYLVFALRIVLLMLTNVKKISLDKLISISFIIIVGYVYKESLLDVMINHGSAYIQEQADGTSYVYFWELIISSIFLLAFLLLLSNYKRSQVTRNEKYDVYSKLMKIIVLFEVIFLFLEYSSFYRLNWLITIIIVPIYMYMCNSNSNNQPYLDRLNKALIVILTFGLSLECLRGDLCALKYV